MKRLVGPMQVAYHEAFSGAHTDCMRLGVMRAPPYDGSTISIV